MGLILSLDNHLWRLKSRSDINPDSLELAKNYKVVVPRNDIQHQLLLDKGFIASQNLIVLSRYEQAIDMIFIQRADLFAGAEVFLRHRLKAINKDNSPLHPVIKLGSQIILIAQAPRQ